MAIIEMMGEMIPEITWSTMILACGAAFIAYFLVMKSQRSNLPPGPTPFPIVGSALAVGILSRPLHETFAMLQKKYGDVFSLRIAGVELAVINGYENIREALVHQSKRFSGRPDITWTSLTQKHGIFSKDGSDSSKQRGLVLGILGTLRWDNQEAAESRIQKTGQDLIEWLTKTDGQPANPQLYLDTAICNATSPLVLGVTFKPSDDLMIAVSKIVKDIFIDAGAQNPNNYFTYLRNFPTDPTNYQVLAKNAGTAMGVIADVIKAHKEKQGSGADKADFIDYYLEKMAAGNDSICSDEELVAIVTDLLAMSIEAPSTTLRWALLLLCRHPDVQVKIQKEIDEVMKMSVPSLEHEKEMEYTKAFITEVQRYVNVVSINLPHAATEDVTFQGYHIAKGTIVIPNLASVHYDENIYPDPQTFRPERFMQSDGFERPDKFMPYSAGGRMCIGKNLSQWQLFLLITSILQKLDLRLDGRVGGDTYGLIRFPGDFKVSFCERKRRSHMNNNYNVDSTEKI